jgi:rSAM/selenodomain-associated transferase 1
LTPAQAADLAHAFVADTLARLCARADWTVALAADGDGERAVLQALRDRHRVAWIEQGEGDLGRRMGRVMARAEQGGPVVLIGADTPDVPVEYVAMAFDSLAGAPVVLGPSRDGGYYLIGMRTPSPDIFDIDAAWSSPRVLGATLARVEQLGLASFLLPAWEDVDDAASLSRLALRLREELSEADRTRDLLAAWRADGVSF